MPVLIVFGAFFAIAGMVMVVAPDRINQINNAKRQALLGNDVRPLKDRPVGQRIAGAVAVAGGLALLIYGLLA